jgi:hypothetical protein
MHPNGINNHSLPQVAVNGAFDYLFRRVPNQALAWGNEVEISMLAA